MQAGDRCLSDILAQPLHRGQSEGNLIPVLDLQEANLQQEGRRKKAPSLTASPGPTHVMPSRILWAFASVSLGILGCLSAPSTSAGPHPNPGDSRSFPEDFSP